MNHKLNAIALAAFCSLFALNHSACAQGTAFTYQGRLNSGGSPANGSYDLQFSLFAANAGGVAIAGPVTNAAVSVTNGLFTTTVDLGNAFTGASNWLQIAVSTNGANAFGPLSPRQQLTPTPYAIYAESANAGSLIGTLSGNGSGLTNLTASQLTIGTVPDAQLSSNVALLNANQTFTGGNTFNGSVGIGTPPAGTVPLSVQGSASIGDGVIEAFQNGGGTTGSGMAGYSLIPGGHGIVGESDTELPNVTGPAASAIGVIGATTGTNGTGVYGAATASTGVNYGIVGQSFSPQGYAGYFLGQSYFGGSVGIGTTSPAKQLDLTGTASGVATGNSIDSSIFMRVNNTASDGNTSAPDFAGIGFGHNSTRQAIVGGTFGNDFLDFYTGGSLTAPKMRIDINGTVGIMTNDVLELGYGVAGKEASAGKIGYEKFTPDSLDIVGAGTNVSARKIKFWAEGGANFNGTVTATAFSGNGGSLTGLSAANLSGSVPSAALTSVPAPNLTGTVDDARLSSNVALRNSPNAFVGNQTVSSGSVGIGTTTPSAHFHVNGGMFETPLAAALFEVQNCGAACATPSWTEAIRLENTEANLTGEVGMGFLTAPAGSSLTNVPDVWIGTDDKASGNTHSFKIATQAGGVLVNRVFINGASGNVGIGTITPTGPLTVATTHGTVTVANGQFVPEMIANGGSSSGHMRFRNALEVWPDTNNVSAGYVDVRDTNGNPGIILDGSNGNVTCVAVNITSDRNAKEHFSPVNARAVLDKVASLPITEWQYKQQSDTRHIGPMAQDFSSAFALSSRRQTYFRGGRRRRGAGRNSRFEREVGRKRCED